MFEEWVSMTVILFKVDYSKRSIAKLRFCEENKILHFPKKGFQMFYEAVILKKYSVCRLSLGRENLTCLIQKRARDILLFIEDKYSFQQRASSICIPRNVQECARIRLFPFMNKLYWSRLLSFFYCWMIMHLEITCLHRTN